MNPRDRSHVSWQALLLLALWPWSGGAESADLADARLLDARADASNWLLHGRSYANERFSPLRQITAENVRDLAPAWIYQSGVSATFQATPIVVDGVMYLSMPFNHVAAIDAKTGRELWRYQHKRRTQKMCCGPQNRGVAVAYGKVYVATVDARLIALDQKTGSVVWDVALATDGGETESPGQAGAGAAAKVSGSTGVGAAMAPVVYRGKVYVGINGVGYGLHLDGKGPEAGVASVIGMAGHYGRPGFLAAFDAESGRRVWQFDTIPAHGWEGEFRETTPDGLPLKRDTALERAAAPRYRDAWQFGGGSAWSTPAIDPAAGLLFFGVGNPSPQMDDVSRPGDNLYTVSLVALHADTGELAWYYQQVPHDLWGYDVASGAVLFDVEHEGTRVPAVGVAGKTGWFYVHDRRDGRLLFKSDPFVPQENLFAHPDKDGVRIAPAAAGGANWSPVAYHPGLGLAYVAAMHRPMRYQVHEKAAGADHASARSTSMDMTDEPVWGTLTALDLRRQGKIRWQRKTPQPLLGGVLATAGNLVFTGEGDGHLSAFDATSGELLWQFQCGAGVNAPPVTYEIDGTQYIAVAAGGNQLFGFRQGDALVVFALPRARR
ncbi:MAG TPA: PQQ-binding-like beta-propeller repeat protein [Burkholderiales bacterium]|nr:PQQ-binding-like beta-propeller repeat protein [Burkholderiales bacterium]